MVRRVAPLPDALPWHVFTYAEAIRAGVSPNRLRRDDLARVRRGLYARTDVDITEVDIAAALCRSDPTVVIVGVSAARLLQFPLPRAHQKWRAKTPVHVTSRTTYRSDSEVVEWHKLVLAPGDVESYTQDRIPPPYRSPLRLTRRSRIWRDLAPLLSLEQSVIIGDHLVRTPYECAEDRVDPWCTIEELSAVCTGRNASELRRALREVRVGADSPMETTMRLAFTRAGLPEPEINVPLIGENGQRFHAPDFQWPAWKICAEYDGRTHAEVDQVPRDIARGIAATNAGFLELRLARDDAAYGCARAVRRVRDALMDQGWRP